MASKRGRPKRRKSTNNLIVWGGVAAVVVIALLIIFVNSRLNSAGAQISFEPPAAAALDNCGSATCGDANAPVTIDLYADFQCPYCAQFEPVLEQLGPDYIDTGKVKLVFHNFAFIGAESDAAAQAVMCAGDQNKFWMFANDLYQHQGAENSGVFTSSNLKKLAAAAGMDSAQFNSCLDGRKYAGAVQQQAAEGRQRQVQSTPTFFVNGQMHAGGVSYDQLVGLVNAALPQ
jgi:protein-disulfide isomerase